MNETVRMLLIICPMVFFGGFVDAVAGGGGLISLPAYMVSGVPVHMATATNKCSAIFGTCVATLQFMKERKIYYVTAISSAIAALLGAPLGALLNTKIEEQYIRLGLIFIIPVITYLIIRKKEVGNENNVAQLSSNRVLILSVIIGFGIGCYDGFLGPGTGMFLILCYCHLMKFDVVTASGNAKVVNLASNLASFITYAFNGAILWELGLPAACFGILGNFLGAKLALKNGQKVIRPMFLVVLGLLLAKMVYDFW